MNCIYGSKNQMTIVAYIEWPDGLDVKNDVWQIIKYQVKAAKADVLVTNEMPFGSWRPVGKDFDKEQAQAWVDEHDNALESLSELNVPAIVTSRPRMVGEKLVNEAFMLEGGNYKTMHQKKHNPFVSQKSAERLRGHLSQKQQVVLIR